MAKRNQKKPRTTRQRRKILRPKTRNQENYMGFINKSDVTFCSGPAGSGKTSVSVGMACEYLIEKKVDKIIITRPVVESGRGLGHLPGTLVEKINPYLIPILEEMNKYLTKYTLLKHNILFFLPYFVRYFVNLILDPVDIRIFFQF